MVVSIWAGDLMTGRLWAKLPVAEGASWAVEHRGEGSIEATVPLVGEVLDRFPAIVENLAPWRCFLAAITDDGVVLEAGPIRPHSYDDATGRLKVSASGLRAYFARRFLMPVLGSGWQRWEVTYSSLSLGTIAKRIVQLTMSHPGGALPIDLPADEAGTNTRTYYGFEMARVSERLRQIEDVENGPDIRFEPYLAEGGALGTVRWRMVTGTAGEPEVTQYNRPGGVPVDLVWDRTAPSSPIDALSVDLDPDEVGDRAWITGSGSDNQLMMARRDQHGLREDGYPLLEVDESRTTVIQQATLNQYAQALARRAQKPWQTWTMTVQAGITPALGTYRAGDWARIYVGNNHPYIRARNGFYRTRIMAISGNQSSAVKLLLAPTLEDR